MTNCAHIQRKLADHFDSGVRPPSDLAAHLATCANCQAFADRLTELDVMLSESVIQPPSDLVARVNTAVESQKHSTRIIGVVLMLTGGLALTACVNWFVPIVPAAKSYWTTLRGVMPKSEWTTTFPTLESQLDFIRSQVANYAHQLQSYPGIAVWGALLAVVMLLVALNGMEAAGVDSIGRFRRGNKNGVAK